MSGRRPWVLPVRITVSVVMLGLLLDIGGIGRRLGLPRVQVASLLPKWDTGPVLWLGAALVFTLGGILLSALRWQAVLTALGIPASITTLFRHYLAGQFVSNFLPSTIGGDVLRVSRLSSANGQRADTFASVVLERLTGWLVLPVITLTALGFNPGLRELGTASAVAAGVAVATLVMLAGLLVAVASPRLGGRLAGKAGWQRFAGAVHLGLDRFRQRPGAAVAVLVTGFAYQLVVVLSAFFAAKALGLPDDVGLTAILAFMPAVAILQVLPISLGGLGVREGAFVLFLGPLGVAAGQAIALGVLFYGLNLIVSLLGAPAFAVGNRPARALA